MLRVRIVRRERVVACEADAMLALMRTYFDLVTAEAFQRDLAAKDWVILLEHPDSGVVGFSTQQLVALELGGRTARYLFSGDTVVDHRHWNQPGLAGAFGHLMAKLIADFRGDDLFWFLISKGPRTYRFLPVFFNDFHPDPLRLAPMRDRFKAPLDAIASRKFGPAYLPDAGVIRFAAPKDRLKPEWQTTPRAADPDPYTRHFFAANPGWRQGDELACLAPIEEANFNALNRRVTRATRVCWE
jgi:hypothetical protein